MGEEHKTSILLSMEVARAKGVSRIRACAMWMINRRRVVRWSGIWRRGQSLDNGKPGFYFTPFQGHGSSGEKLSDGDKAL